MSYLSAIQQILGNDAEYLLNFQQPKIPNAQLRLPGSDPVQNVFTHSNRNNRTLASIHKLYNSGRLAGSGYLSILPVDQGIEHSAGAAFAPNPDYFNPDNIVQLAIDAQCNAVASSFGVLALNARKFAHKINYIVKINHNQLLSYPNQYDQVLYGSVKDAYNMGAIGIGATIYWGSQNADRQLQEVAQAFETAHHFGLLTILWCYLRNDHFKQNNNDFHNAADLTAQANHLGVTIQADIIKQKLPTNNGGFNALNFGKTHPNVYQQLTSNHPIDLCRYQVANCYMGQIGLINSGGEADTNPQKNLHNALKTAVINKKAGGIGLILGRKAFQNTHNNAINLLNLVQNVFLEPKINVV